MCVCVCVCVCQRAPGKETQDCLRVCLCVPNAAKGKQNDAHSAAATPLLPQPLNPPSSSRAPPLVLHLGLLGMGTTSPPPTHTHHYHHDHYHHAASYLGALDVGLGPVAPEHGAHLLHGAGGAGGHVAPRQRLQEQEAASRGQQAGGSKEGRGRRGMRCGTREDGWAFASHLLVALPSAWPYSPPLPPSCIDGLPLLSSPYPCPSPPRSFASGSV